MFWVVYEQGQLIGVDGVGVGPSCLTVSVAFYAEWNLRNDLPAPCVNVVACVLSLSRACIRGMLPVP